MRYFRLQILLLILSLSLQFKKAAAQANIDQLLETHWRYTYTLHVETNSLSQQAGDRLRHYLYFRFDSVCRQEVNGRQSESPWRLDKRQIRLDFRQNGLFSVLRLNDFSLELKFLSKDGKSTFVHHFTRVKADISPLALQSNTLPVVLIQTVPPLKADTSRAAQAIALPPAGNDDDVCIELVGGGYYGGINPVQHDYITISREGRLIHEFESVQGKRLIHKVNIPKDELEKFIDWAAVEQHFFDSEPAYDCKTPECEKRKTVKPAPVPLRLSITKDGKRRMITVSIWGLDKNGRRYVSYPPELDRIIDAIQRMASREKSVR